MPYLSISLLGSFQVLLGEGDVAHFETNKVQALLAYLAVESGRVHERSVLAGFLWPDQSEQNARNNLRQSLFRLRRTLGNPDASQPFLEFSNQTLRFSEASNHWLDVRAFTKLFHECRQHVHQDPAGCEACREHLQEAVALYQGDFLSGFTLGDSPAFEEWLTMQREWLRRQYLEALQTLVLSYQHLEDYERALFYARQQLELDLLSEASHRSLMRLLALSGQRGAAITQYRLCRQLLEKELNLEPAVETEELFDQIRHGQLLGSEKLSRPELITLQTGSVLPSPLGHLVGRKQEFQQLLGLLNNPAGHITTLTGPAGIGKSALAKAIASEQATHFQGRVCFLALDGLTTAEALIQALADHCHCEPSRPGLLRALHDQRLLIILDGFDRLQSESWLLLEWAQNSPQTRFLVTTRNRLNLSQEWVFALNGLPIPVEGSTKDLLSNSSVQMFLTCAGRVNQDFAANDSELQAIAHICRLVEGNPLGLELAANWIRALSCREIAWEIEKSPHALAYTLHDLPLRHHSLGALFEDTWQHLSAKEQATLQRMTVFRGGFSRSAVETIAQTDLATIARLLDQSLIRRQAERYYLPELLRQFTAEKLTRLVEEKGVYRRYAHYYAHLLNQQLAGLCGKGQRQALEVLEQELGNVEQSWHWAGQHQDQEVLELAAPALFHFYNITGRVQKGYEAFQGFTGRGIGLVQRGWFAYQLRYLGEAKDLMEQALTLLQSDGTPLTFVLPYLAIINRASGDYEEAGRFAERGLTLSQQSGDWFTASLSLNIGGAIAHDLGQRVKARQMVEQSMVFKRLIGDRWGMAFCFNLLGRIAYTAGSYQEAERCFREGLRLHQEVGNKQRMVKCLSALGDVSRVMALMGQARQWYQECLATCQTLNDPAGMTQARLKLGQLARQSHQYQEAQHQYHTALRLAVAHRLAAKSVEILTEFGYMLQEMKSLGLGLPQPQLIESDGPAGELLANELLRQFTAMMFRGNLQTPQIQLMVNDMLSMVI